MPSYVGDPLLLQALSTPAAPALSVRGTPGDATYTYVVVAKKGSAATAASDEATTEEGPATLTAINHIRVTPYYVVGAQSYDIYRVAGGESQGKIGTLTAFNRGTTQSASFVDRGQTGDDAEAPTFNTTNRLTLGTLTSGDDATLVGVSGQLEVQGDILQTGADRLLGLFGGAAVVQQNHIADPSAGDTVDSQARTAIASILNALEAYGLLKTS